jgi:hypothetical protein
VDPHHSRITQIALAVAADYGFALAGGYAVSAHGMGQRLSGDVDLFMDWQRRGDFQQAVDAVIDTLESHQYAATATVRNETFARLQLDDVSRPGSEPAKLELSVDWRAHDPVLLSVGPVLHPDDAVANKMCALYGRAEARDFMDVDAAITSGRYTRVRLLELAARADAGFDRTMFAGALGALHGITDDEFGPYGVAPGELAALRARFEQWRTELRNS